MSKVCGYCKKAMPVSYGGTTNEKDWQWRSNRGRGSVYCGYNCMMWANYRQTCSCISGILRKKGYSEDEIDATITKKSKAGDIVKPTTKDPREEIEEENTMAQITENNTQTNEEFKPIRRMKHIDKLVGIMVEAEVDKEYGQVLNLMIDSVDNGDISLEKLIEVHLEIGEIIDAFKK